MPGSRSKYTCAEAPAPAGEPKAPLVAEGNYLFVDGDKFSASFAADVDIATTRFMSCRATALGTAGGADQGRSCGLEGEADLLHGDKRGSHDPADRATQSWPDASGAKVAELKSSHAVMLSHPREVAAFIKERRHIRLPTDVDRGRTRGGGRGRHSLAWRDGFACPKQRRCGMALKDILPGKLGFGAAPLGSMFRDIPEQEALATVNAAWDDGIRYFDNAPFYGAGLAEIRMGAGARRQAARRLCHQHQGRPRDPGRDRGCRAPATSARRATSSNMAARTRS